MFMPDYECQLVENAFDILIPKLRVGSSTLPGASTSLLLLVDRDY